MTRAIPFRFNRLTKILGITSLGAFILALCLYAIVFSFSLTDAPPPEFLPPLLSVAAADSNLFTLLASCFLPLLLYDIYHFLKRNRFIGGSANSPLIP